MQRGHDGPQLSLRDVNRCVIVTRGDDLPAGLLASLESKSIETVLWGHPLEAFAQLVRWARDDAAAGSWGLPHRRAALVIAARDRWESLDRLLQAVDRHFPDVSVWMGTDELLLQIRPETEADSGRSRQTPPIQPLRLAGTGALSDLVDQQAERDAAAAPPDSAPSSGKAPRSEPSAPAPRIPTPPNRAPAPESATEPEPDLPRDRGSGQDSIRNTAVTPDEIEMLLRLFDELDDPTEGPPAR